MDLKENLKEIASDFDLELDFESNFKFLQLPKREIIMKNFVCGCPVYPYKNFGSGDEKNLEKNLSNFLNSKEYREELNGPQACVVSRNELGRESDLIKQIHESQLKQELENIYLKINNQIGDSEKITLIWKPYETETNGSQRKEILLHEHTHELLEYNGIRPNNWRWNEGLVTYITYRATGNLNRLSEKPKLKQNPDWYTYAKYAREWLEILKGIEDPGERKNKILGKINEVSSNK